MEAQLTTSVPLGMCFLRRTCSHSTCYVSRKTTRECTAIAGHHQVVAVNLVVALSPRPRSCRRSSAGWAPVGCADDDGNVAPLVRAVLATLARPPRHLADLCVSRAVSQVLCAERGRGRSLTSARAREGVDLGPGRAPPKRAQPAGAGKGPVRSTRAGRCCGRAQRSRDCCGTADELRRARHARAGQPQTRASVSPTYSHWSPPIANLALTLYRAPHDQPHHGQYRRERGANRLQHAVGCSALLSLAQESLPSFMCDLLASRKSAVYG